MALKYLIRLGYKNQKLTVYTVSAVAFNCLLHWTTLIAGEWSYYATTSMFRLCFRAQALLGL